MREAAFNLDRESKAGSKDAAEEAKSTSFSTVGAGIYLTSRSWTPIVWEWIFFTFLPWTLEPGVFCIVPTPWARLVFRGGHIIVPPFLRVSRKVPTLSYAVRGETATFQNVSLSTG
ncbi:Hypothetical protein NTJ_10956 [Nesidiocoris tenuis]|uniref:Uncharacterized protein n=1 Tax=Nesidiocoris tenuis TaxID=355587 RepID=A0ABN7B139_9HEMI|nr:Hypothetical protein NTJ_10956 [Nesidiocoris tenuis]